DGIRDGHVTGVQTCALPISLVSEFPEMASTVYFARTVDRASMALMNMVSSNINQWTLLTAMLPILYSISIGTATPIVFDPQQRKIGRASCRERVERWEGAGR